MGPSFKPSRVAFYLPSLRGGGAERVTATLANGLVRRGHAVDMVLAKAEGPYLAELDSEIRVVDLKSGGVLSSLPGLVRYLRRQCPDAVMSSMWHANIIAMWAKWLSVSKARFILREASTLSLNLNNFPLWQRRIFRYLIHLNYPLADSIIAPSLCVAVDLREHAALQQVNISTVPNPVIHRGLVEKAQAPLAHPWFEKDAPPVVISVGRLGDEKDFSTLVRAFARVHEKLPSRLLILGEGPQRTVLDNLIRELGLTGKVSLPGFVVNPWSYMSRGAVYVLTSRYEGLPNALIEAMAMGSPVVATDCPCGPREILAEGKYGRLVPVGDTEALSKAILETLEMPRLAYPEEALAPFRLERVLDIYEKLLSVSAFGSGSSVNGAS